MSAFSTKALKGMYQKLAPILMNKTLQWHLALFGVLLHFVGLMENALLAEDSGKQASSPCFNMSSWERQKDTPSTQCGNVF